MDVLQTLRWNEKKKHTWSYTIFCLFTFIWTINQQLINPKGSLSPAVIFKFSCQGLMSKERFISVIPLNTQPFSPHFPHQCINWQTHRLMWRLTVFDCGHHCSWLYEAMAWLVVKLPQNVDVLLMNELLKSFWKKIDKIRMKKISLILLPNKTTNKFLTHCVEFIGQAGFRYLKLSYA